LRIKLRHLEDWNRARRRRAWEYNRWLVAEQGIIRPYDEGLQSAGVDPVPASCDNYSVYHQYTVRVQRRDTVALRLGQCGIGNAVYYPVPLHLQKVHQRLGYAAGTFPHAEACARECLSLPMFPDLTAEQCERAARELVRAVREAVREGS
ncbi:MAG: DegT/DnrJ/EryC1/StrS family aminotransferase, partial [Pirellulaceae bacterium]